MTGNKRKSSAKTVVTAVTNLARRSPRMNLSGRLNENVSFITGNEYNDPCTVAGASNSGHGQVNLIPGNTGGRSNAAVNGVGRYFQQGVYLPGTFLKYIPSVGLNTAGNIVIGFIDNPDVIRAWYALSNTARLNFVRDLNNAKTGPVWQEMTFPLTQPPRRRVFNIDPVISSSSTDDLDQSCQGIFVWVIYGVVSATDAQTFGQLMIHCKTRFEEVKSFTAPQPA